MSPSSHEPSSQARRGNAAVEFALVLPLLLTLLLGMIDYGYVYFTQLTLTNAAREGARVGVTRINQEDVEPAVRTAVLNYIRAAHLREANATIGFQFLPDGSDFMVRVTIDFRTEPPANFISFLPDNLHASAAMRWEGPL